MKLSDYLALERGAQAKLSKLLDIPAPLLSQWATGARAVPAERCPQIERATQGAVRVDELLPVAQWARIADPGWPHPAGRPVLDFASPDLVAPAEAGEGTHV